MKRKGLYHYDTLSWSQQAREKADMAFDHWQIALMNPCTEWYGFVSHDPEYWFHYNIANSYRPQIIVLRAAKRYGKKVRKRMGKTLKS